MCFTMFYHVVRPSENKFCVINLAFNLFNTVVRIAQRILNILIFIFSLSMKTFHVI